MAIDRGISFVTAQRLKELRTQKGLSYEALRNKLIEKYGVEISIDSLKNYEVSKDSHVRAYKNEGMRVSYLRCLADFYGVSSDYLLGLTDVKSQSLDVRMIVDSTGLSEENVMVLCLAKTLSSLYSFHEDLEGQAQNLETEFKKTLHLEKYPLTDRELLPICAHFTSLIDDVIDAITSDEGILFDYGSIKSTEPTIENFNGTFDPEFQKQLAKHGFSSLPAPQYVRFMAAELAKKIDRYFIEKYWRGYY